jgi:hypothetical protein
VRRSFAARFRTHRDTALEIASDSTHFGMFLLSKPSPLRLWAIVDEAALHRQIGGPDVMRAQLVHLIKAASEPPVTLQVIPYSAGAHAGRPGSFALLDFPNPADPAVVHIDTMAGDLFLESETDLRRYRLLFEHLRASKDPAGPALTFTPAGWTAFAAGVRAGEFA